MSAIDLAVARLADDEGFRATAYKDTAGHTTIGFGFNVDAGISQYAALELLTAQTVECAQALSQYPWAQGLDDVRLSVLIELAFNLGLTGLLHFPKTLAAIGTKNWTTAAAELMNSAAAQELPRRYSALATMLQTGVSA